MTTTATLRRFRVHAGHIDKHHAVLVEEDSFEAAVVAFVEDHPAAADTDAEMRVIVHEVASGHESRAAMSIASGSISQPEKRHPAAERTNRRAAC
jgi:hypothetical protein